MSILDLQRRLVEVGRIRMGTKVPTGTKGKSRPAKADTWRLTSSDVRRLEEVAQAYGGTVTPWEDQHEVQTAVDALDIALIPGQALSQHMELWGQEVEKGPVVCLRRCDGQTELLADKPCLCRAEGDEELACKPTTRLLVMLRRIPGIGAWRLDTKGWNAAQELYGTAGLLESLTAAGQLVPARLRLEQRTKQTRQGRRNFVVPVIDIDVALDQVLAATGAHALGAGQGSAPPAIAAPFTPVPVEQLPEAPFSSVADQIGLVGQPQGPRSNAAAVIPPTGVRPRSNVIDVEESLGEASGTAEESTPRSSARTVNRVAIAAREAGLDDDGRHALAAWVSEGRTSSSKELEELEVVWAIAACERIKSGTAKLTDNTLVHAQFGWPIPPAAFIKPEAVDAIAACDALGLEGVQENVGTRLNALGKAGIAAWYKADLPAPVELTKRQLPKAFRVLVELEPF